MSAQAADNSAPEPSRRLSPARPVARQETVRQWILLVPLATAVAGSAAAQLAEDYVQYLSPLFFAGALLITAAMLQQRVILRRNQELSSELRDANAHLDTMHRLQFDLNQSLDVAQVGQSVLNHALQTLGADAAALWLRPQFDSGAMMRCGTPEGEAEPLVPCGKNWHLAAADGWDDSERRAVLENWNRALDSAPAIRETRVGARVGAQGEATSDSWLTPPTGAPPQFKALAMPICWEEEIIGVLAVAFWQGALSEENTATLRDMALVTGPALQNALLYQRTLTRADFDGLTGLLNHRAVQERLAQELARTQRVRFYNPQSHFAIAIFDLTDFKLFNDTYGHAMGDEVLRTVSRTLRQTFRISDIVARYGGDEFLAILPEADEHGAGVIASRIVEALRGEPFQAEDGSKIVIRLTCGIAVYPQDGNNGADLFQSADARLYEAKQAGTPMISYVRLQPEVETKEAASLWGKFGVLDALITAIDNRDHYTRKHSEQTMCYALLLARELKQPRETLEAVRISGLLYDVGKIAVPDAILRKPGLLSADEKHLMQQHCRFGAMLVQEVAHRAQVLEGVQSHHEAFNGGGYPEGLSGEGIPWIARLLAVADCFAAMTTDRPYRRALSPEVALEELKKMRGAQFDPEIVDGFARVLAPTIEGRQTLRDTLQNALDFCAELDEAPVAAK